ncbi:UNVERIFIED_CONTAM: hypothetical protein HDU68_009411 [Siphonaria sp. JEL0065]|nr:hypothetical protein HDU68_009411 [Siphonaria sp. JEL0065]
METAEKAHPKATADYPKQMKAWKKQEANKMLDTKIAAASGLVLTTPLKDAKSMAIAKFGLSYQDTDTDSVNSSTSITALKQQTGYLNMGTVDFSVFDGLPDNGYPLDTNKNGEVTDSTTKNNLKIAGVLQAIEEAGLENTEARCKGKKKVYEYTNTSVEWSVSGCG